MDFNKVYDKVISKLEEWLETLLLMLPNIGVAIIIVIIFFILGRLFKKLSGKVLNKISDHTTINNLISKIVFIIIFSAGFFIALGVLKLDKAVTSLLAGVGIIGLALGFAFQDMAANFMSGIAIAIKQPFKVNDIIESNNFFGTVKKISLRTTDILTPQGQIVLIPNKEVFQKPLINYSVTGERRVDLKVGISYGDDLEKVKKVASDAVKNIPNQDASKEPEIFFEEFADSSINFVIRVWIRFQRNRDYKRAVSEVIEKVKKAFEENDIMIPFPIRTLDFGIKGGKNLSEMMKGDSGEKGN
jgi:small-conductance mechanosensitive channel